MFSLTSRYYRIEIVKQITGGGREIVYLRRRFIPEAAASLVFTEHEVTEGDRLDNVTAEHLGDPEQFWRICDATNAMRPEDLIEVGRRLRIPLPQ